MSHEIIIDANLPVESLVEILKTLSRSVVDQDQRIAKLEQNSQVLFEAHNKLIERLAGATVISDNSKVN